MFYISLTIVLAAILLFFKLKKKDKWKTPKNDFPDEWRLILIKEVPFYNALQAADKKKFEYKIQEFLLNCRITGIEIEVEPIDRVLVAASAIIPIFGFDDWRYNNIHEVLLYSDTFNHDFETEGRERRILGMVGTGYMEGVMILSKQALRVGFKNETDKKNTAIHEFVHLIDKADGQIDGVPSLLLQKQYAIPWLDLINKKIEEIYEGESDINPYGGTNRAEFFSVTSEYFFERPKLLAKKHPKLYSLLEQIFNQNMDDKNLNKVKIDIGRNDPCPCNSGKKFKNCCGKVHYH